MTNKNNEYIKMAVNFGGDIIVHNCSTDDRCSHKICSEKATSYIEIENHYLTLCKKHYKNISVLIYKNRMTL